MYKNVSVPLNHRQAKSKQFYENCYNYYELLVIYVETSVRNKCRCSFYCALFTLHVSAPIGGHLQVVTFYIYILWHVNC
jgi:hypothetical protein